MDIQFVLMVVIFAASLFYVGRIIYRSVSPKNDGCGTGCGKCAANFDQVKVTKK